MYNTKVDIYKAEKKKTEKLLSSLLPTSVIRKLKKGMLIDTNVENLVFIISQDNFPNLKYLRVFQFFSVTS